MHLVRSALLAASLLAPVTLFAQAPPEPSAPPPPPPADAAPLLPAAETPLPSDVPSAAPVVPEAVPAAPVPESVTPPSASTLATPVEASVTAVVPLPRLAEPRRPAVLLTLGPGTVARSFTFAPAANPKYPDLAMDPQLAMGMGAQWFPGAHTTQGGLADLGLFLDARFGYGIFVQGYGSTWAVHAQQLRGGLVYRLGAGPHQLDLHAGIVHHAWDTDAVSSDGLLFRPKFPNVDLTGARVGASGRYRLDRVFVTLDVGGVLAWRLGELTNATFFPDATGLGFDFRVGLALPLGERFEARLTFESSRYLYELNAPASAVVTAAADQVAGTNLSLTCRL